MERVIGIFESRNLETALNALHSYGVNGRDITLVDSNGTVDGPEPGNMPFAISQPSNTVPPAIVGPAAAGMVGGNGAENSLSPTGNGAVVPSLFGLLAGAQGVDRAMDFYQSAVNNGATLVIVRCKAEHANNVRQIMKQSHASNVSGDFTANTGSGGAA